MKKKILSILVTIFALCTCAFNISACNETPPPHTHNYSIIKYDQENHWYECTCKDKTGFESHKGGTATYATKATILDTTKCNAFEEWAMANLLDLYKGDLQQIEQSLRYSSVYNSRNGLTERMNKFQAVKNKINRKESEIVKQVRNILFNS